MTGSRTASARHLPRIPVTAVAVIGFGGLVLLSVGLALLLGLRTATTNTSEQLKTRATSIISQLEARLDGVLRPVTSQGQWIARRLEELPAASWQPEILDTFMHATLAATPQVAGIGVVDDRFQIRRWRRSTSEVHQEDWSGRDEIVRWVKDGATRRNSTWRQPLWTTTLNATVLIYDTPLHRDATFDGMLAQLVPLRELSNLLAVIQADDGPVPFIIYGRDKVLAHPMLAGVSDTRDADDQGNGSLMSLSQLGDAVLSTLLSGGEEPFLLRGLTGITARGADFGGHYHVLLKRELTRYGETPWTVGVHLDTAGVEGDSTARIDALFEAGLGLLVLALLLAVLVGRRLSAPVKLLAEAAEAVRGGRYDEVPVLPRSRIREMDTALTSFSQMVQDLQERQLIRDVLGRFVPESVARTLLSAGGTLPAREGEATVLFCDLQGFTSLTERLGPTRTMTLLNEFFEAVVEVLERHDGIVTQFQGDAVLAVFNLPTPNPEHARAALRAAAEIQQMTARKQFAGESLVCRIGVNTGELVAGAVGAHGRLSYTVHGDAVNLAARLESLNKEHGTRVLVSGSTAQRVPGAPLRHVGAAPVRGHTRPVDLYELLIEETGPG